MKWKVITLVRDPIARNVSEFFYSVDTTKHSPHLPDFYEQYRTRSLSTKALIERFMECFHQDSLEYNTPLSWFDDELKPVLGIDVYSEDFPMSKGYQFFEGDSADVLLLKLEGISNTIDDALKEFLNIEDFNLVTANTAKEKGYYSAYQDFLSQVNLPDAYLDNTYNSKLVKHFYSEEEVRSFRRKWHKG